jgi:hypothetical protein
MLPNYQRHLPTLKVVHEKRVVRKLRLPRHSQYIGYPHGDTLDAVIHTSVDGKAVPDKIAIQCYEIESLKRDLVLYRLLHGSLQQVRKPRPPSHGYNQPPLGDAD